MKKNEEIQLNIEILPPLKNEHTQLAEQLERGLGGKATVQLTDKTRPTSTPRGLDPEIMQIISLTFSGLGVLISLAKLLLDTCKKNNRKLLILTNPKNGKTVAISETDSMARVEKKLQEILKKEGIKMTIKK